MTWSSAGAFVGSCTVGNGGSCGQPGGVRFLAREVDTEFNEESIGASVRRSDYSHLTPVDLGMAWSSAEAGEGLLGLPTLKAFAARGGAGFGQVPNPTIAVNVASVQAIQGYTNTTENALIIPLNAFSGLVDYELFGPPRGPGTVYAGLAITTSAILDPAVAAQWAGAGTTGQFNGTCSTPGALAIGNPLPRTSVPTGSTQYLPVTTSSCTGSDAYTLNPGDSFYVWARLAAVRASFGITDVSHTFNIEITPQALAAVEQLAPSLTRADGSNLVIPTAVVPEPATWAMMILGFGAAGSLLRRRGGAVRA